MRGHGSQWISYKINIRHPLQLKKSKSWEPFRSYQLNSTANPAHLPQNWAKYLFYMKSIETHARAFLAFIILPIGTVSNKARHNLMDAKSRWHSDRLDGAVSFRESLSQTKVMQICQGETLNHQGGNNA